MDNIMAYKSRLTYEEIEPAIRELSMVKYSIIKGEALSVAAYNAVGMRTSSDVDVLVSRKNLHIFEMQLLEHGFEKQYSDSTIEQRTNRALMLSGSHQISPFYMQKGVFKLSIDLNFDIFWGEYIGKRVDIDDFLSDTIEMEIYGVKIKTLPPLKAIVQLILHHYKDINSIYHLAGHNCIKHSMFKDVYYLWKNNTDAISLDKLYSISAEYEIIPYVFYVLYFTNEIFKDNILKNYVDGFRTADGVELLNSYGLSEKERKQWKVDFQTRLESKNMYDLIKDDLTNADLEKLERNRSIFR